jgi:hypothetical protein
MTATAIADSVRINAGDLVVPPEPAGLFEEPGALEAAARLAVSGAVVAPRRRRHEVDLPETWPTGI